MIAAYPSNVVRVLEKWTNCGDFWNRESVVEDGVRIDFCYGAPYAYISWDLNFNQPEIFDANPW